LGQTFIVTGTTVMEKLKEDNGVMKVLRTAENAQEVRYVLTLAFIVIGTTVMGKFKEETGVMAKFLNVYIVDKEQHLALIPAPALLTHLIPQDLLIPQIQLILQAHLTLQAHQILQVHQVRPH
jgi:hypothetical protein